MIRGYFVGSAGRRRAFVDATVEVRSTGRLTEVDFLIDTGADRSLLSSRVAGELGLDIPALPRGRSRGVGGAAAVAFAEALLRLGARRFLVNFRVLADEAAGSPPEQPVIPSVLGGDILSHFGLYVEERRDLVLLLEQGEVEALRFGAGDRP